MVLKWSRPRRTAVYRGSGRQPGAMYRICASRKLVEARSEGGPSDPYAATAFQSVRGSGYGALKI